MLNSNHIICTSMPRSGHHLLVRLLTGYYQDKFIYCDYYGVHNKNCCNKIPCINYIEKLKSDFVFMQKSHDHSLKDPILDKYKYIIQYRHPIPRSISNFQLYVKKDRENRDTKEGFKQFLDIEFNYYMGFYQKWLVGAKSNILLLKYEDLSASSLESFQKVVRFVENNEFFDNKKWSDAQKELEYRSKKKDKYQQNDISDFKFFEETMLKEFEKTIFFHCPNLEYESYF